MANYYCEHCGKKFTAPEAVTQRCPSCFWTTSVHLIDEPDAPKKENLKPAAQTPLKNPELPKNFSVIFKILAMAALAGLIFWLLRNNFQKPGEILQYVKPSTQKETEPKIESKSKPISSKQAPMKADFGALSESDAAVLNRKISMEIPRELSSDELEIMNRRANFPFQPEKFQTPRMWSLDEFEAFLEKQQRTRGVYFNWGYERKLVQLFKNHYLKAGEALSKNNYESARLEFIQALVFPIYTNDALRHKAVALVMLQPYINDVLGKLHQLNTHLLMARVQSLIQPAQMKYETLFTLLEEKNIERALELAESLEKEIESINRSASQTQVDYPPTVAQIDSDIRRGIDLQDEALEPVSAGLNSVAADLRIKKRVLSQNLPGSLRATWNEYETALAAIQEEKWEEVLLALQKIQYPPELADDAREKEAVIKKFRA